MNFEIIIVVVFMNKQKGKVQSKQIYFHCIGLEAYSVYKSQCLSACLFVCAIIEDASDPLPPVPAIFIVYPVVPVKRSMKSSDISLVPSVSLVKRNTDSTAFSLLNMLT